MLEVEPLGPDGLLLLTPKRHADHRGWFCETWNERSLAEAGVHVRFVQDNHSLSEKAGTLRGLHFQAEPMAQAKLVSVIEGAIFDVVVDIRRASPGFGRWTGVELDAQAGRQLFVPEGFAHGFVTLTPRTLVAYKVSCHHSPAHERAIRFDDPAIGIDWPARWPFILSAKDGAAPMLGDVPVEDLP